MCFEIKNHHIYLKSNQGLHKPDDESVASVRSCQISLVKSEVNSCRYGWLSHGISSWLSLLFLHSLLFNVQCPLPLKWFPLPLLLHSSCFAAAVFRLSTLFWNSSPLFTLLCYSLHFLANFLFLAFWVSKIVFFKTNFLIDTYSKNYRHTHTHTHKILET